MQFFSIMFVKKKCKKPTKWWDINVVVKKKIMW